MFKSLMLAGGVALSAMALAPAAEAKTNVSIHLGVPFYDYQAGPGWDYYDGYGWYDAARYPDFGRRHHRARSNFTIYFGVPFYAERMGPGWRYYEGYGWDDYRRHGEFRPGRSNLSCDAARRLVDRSGYDRVKTVECNGSTYTFRAVDNAGHRVQVQVNARTGKIF